MCYKLLIKIEPDVSRTVMMHQRRFESLEFLKKELNPNTYQVRMMEFGAELADIYSDLFEIACKTPKKVGISQLDLATKCIDNGNIFTSIVYKKEDKSDKFEYLTTMLNLELSSASKMTKLYTPDMDPKIFIVNNKKALDVYKKLNAYIEEYM